jgi:hypothetical protein
MKHFITAVYLFTAFLSGCTFTTTQPKEPVFTTGKDSILKQLNNTVRCENFNVYGSAIVSNGNKSSQLEIDVINGKNIPGNDTTMIRVAKQLALLVKQYLKDKNEYDTYKVLFIKQSFEHGITKRSWRGQSFTNKDLRTIPQPVKTI